MQISKSKRTKLRSSTKKSTRSSVIKSPLRPKTRSVRARRYKLVDISVEKSIKGPSLDARYNLQPGHFAKVIFIEKGIPQRERMWVKIDKRGGGGKYSGILDNKPVIMKNVKLGDRIIFSTRNIIAIMK